MALLALAGFLLAQTPTAAAVPTQLQANAEVNDSRQVTVVGTLSSAAVGIGPAEVRVLLNATPLGSTTTSQQGVFHLSAALPDDIVGGQHIITVSFNGDGEHDPSSAVLPLSLDAPQEPATTAPPPDTRANAVPTLTVDPTEVDPGALLTLTGSVSLAGDPLASVAVRFSIGGTDSPDSLTYTGDDGRYSTFLEVPQDQAPGQTEVRVAVAEGRSHKAGSQTAALTIRVPDVETEEPTPTPSLDATPTPEPTPEDTDIAEATSSVTAPAEEESEDTTVVIAPSPWSWFLIALVTVGGSALLVTIALLMRRNANLEGHDATETVFRLDTEAWDDDAAWEQSQPDPDDDGPPTQESRPRRSLPADED